MPTLRTTVVRDRNTIEPDAFTLGATKPDGSNTGPRVAPATTYGAPGSLYTYTINGPGVHGPFEVYGRIIVATGVTTGVTIQDVTVHMTAPGTTARYGILFDDPNADADGNLVQFCKVDVPDPADRTEWVSAAYRGRGFSLWRCEARDTVDGVHAVGKTGATEIRKVRVRGSYLHGFTARDSISQGTTHDDGIQVFGEVELEADGNTLEGGVTSCIILNQSVGSNYGPVSIRRNWLHGDPTAGATINIALPATLIPSLDVTLNRVDRAGHDSGQITVQAPNLDVPAAFGATSGTAGVPTGWSYGAAKNVYMDDGSEVRIQAG